MSHRWKQYLRKKKAPLKDITGFTVHYKKIILLVRKQNRKNGIWKKKV